MAIQDLTPADHTFVKLLAAGDPTKGIKPNNATRAYMESYGVQNYHTAANVGSKKVKDVNIQAQLATYRDTIAKDAGDAIKLMGQTIRSRKAPLPTRIQTAQYVTDQALGKATQRTELHAITATINMDLSGGKAGDVPKDVPIRKS